MQSSNKVIDNSKKKHPDKSNKAQKKAIFFKDPPPLPIYGLNNSPQVDDKKPSAKSLSSTHPSPVVEDININALAKAQVSSIAVSNIALAPPERFAPVDTVDQKPAAKLESSEKMAAVPEDLTASLEAVEAVV
jgi:hypothetical protein